MIGAKAPSPLHSVGTAQIGLRSFNNQESLFVNLRFHLDRGRISIAEQGILNIERPKSTPSSELAPAIDSLESPLATEFAGVGRTRHRLCGYKEKKHAQKSCGEHAHVQTLCEIHHDLDNNKQSDSITPIKNTRQPQR